MKQLRTMRTCALGYAVPMLFAAATAYAQPFPEKPIRFIVPFAPGGSTDYLARLVGQRMSESMKQPVLIDNRGGAGGTIGADMAAKAPADGHTIVLTAISHATVVGFVKRLPYDLTSDLHAVSLIATQPNALAIHPSLPVKSVKAFIALAKARPGQLAYSSTGNGSAQHLMGELFKAMAQIDMVHVGYKGTSPALTDLIAGNVQASMQPVINAAPMAKAGRIRLLALTGPKRSSAVPDVPTMIEAGLPKYDVVAWYGVHAPARTPRANVDTLNREIVQALSIPDIRERITARGMDPSPNSPDEFQSFVVAEVARWRKVIADAGLRSD